VTRRLEARFSELASEASEAGNPERAELFGWAARRLFGCRREHCGSVFCPRCSGRKARRYRERIEGHLTAAKGAQFSLVTLTVGCDVPVHGYDVLIACAGLLRRRQVWTEVVAGGQQHIEVKPTDRITSARPWNVHLHAIVEIVPKAKFNAEKIRAEWCDLVRRHDLPGNADVQPIRRKWAKKRP
jgi:hypothetical protein